MSHAADLCHSEHTTLLMVDIQTKLMATMGADDRVQVINQGKLLLQAAAQLSVPVLVTEQYPKGLGPTEAALAERLTADTPTLTKTCFSSCGAEGFRDALDPAREQVVLFGIEAHVCVLQTALELHAMSKQVFVVEDAICSRAPAHRRNAIERMRQAGNIITNSESVLFEWLRDARHEQFKTLTALIK